MHTHILLATDGSDSASKAEDYALQLNGNCGIKLTIMHVLDDKLCHYGEVDTLAPLEARETFISYVIEEQKEASEEIVKILNDKAQALNAKFELVIKQGNPVEEIAKFTKQENLPLIIVGGRRSRKSRGFRAISFADKLAALTEARIIMIV